MYVRIDSIGRHGLTADQMLDAAALALTELGVAEALAMVHGPERGLRRYFEAGGAIRFTPRGDPYVPVTGKPPAANAGRCPGPGGCFPHQECPYSADDCAAR